MPLALKGRNGRPIRANNSSQRGPPRTSRLVNANNKNPNMPHGLAVPLVPVPVGVPGMLDGVFLVPAGVNARKGSVLQPVVVATSPVNKGRSALSANNFATLFISNAPAGQLLTVNDLEKKAYERVGGKKTNKHKNSFNNLNPFR